MTYETKDEEGRRWRVNADGYHVQRERVHPCVGVTSSSMPAMPRSASWWVQMPDEDVPDVVVVALAMAGDVGR